MSAAAEAGKAVLVTGGNDGIGLALCRQLAAEHGCRVLMASRSAERGEAAVASVEPGSNGSVELVVMDVAEDASVAEAAAEVARRLGGDSLFAVVNNAGAGCGRENRGDIITSRPLYPLLLNIIKIRGHTIKPQDLSAFEMIAPMPSASFE